MWAFKNWASLLGGMCVCGKGRRKRPFQVEEVVKTRCGGSREDTSVCQDKEKKENKFP